MKDALILLAFAIPVLGHAQISTLRHDLPPQNQYRFHIDQLRELLLPGLEPHHRRPLSRAEVAVAAWQLVQIANARCKNDEALAAMPQSERDQWRNLFWILRWLPAEVEQEFTAIGYSQADYDEWIKVIKQNLARHGIVVEDPYARFADVPEGHWADEAIHSLRRAGIIRGYPDNTFRF